MIHVRTQHLSQHLGARGGREALFETGAECNIIRDRGSPEGRDSGSQREPAAAAAPQDPLASVNKDQGAALTTANMQSKDKSIRGVDQSPRRCL